MHPSFALTRFAPLSLRLERIGPFQQKIAVVDFTVDAGEPANYFMLLSGNGRGKTNLLELMASLMGVLGQRPDRQPNKFGFEPLDIGDGRAQWDLKISYSCEGKHFTEVLSIFGGRADDEVWFYPWSEEALLTVGATAWRRIGIIRRSNNEYRWVGLQDAWSKDFLSWISELVGDNLERFANSPLTAPTMIYFPAYRDIVALPDEEQKAINAPDDWNYRPLHVFRQEGRKWTHSLDNLLVWLMWLNDGRYEAALELVNSYVFDGTDKKLIGIPNRNELVARVDPGDSSKGHRLDQLSSGEKSLMQIFLRMGAHMTKNTILIIDEVDAHLHPKWRSRVAMQLKAMLQEHPGMTTILASHADELIDSLNLELQEPGLRKSALLLESPEEEARGDTIRQTAEFEFGEISTQLDQNN